MVATSNTSGNQEGSQSSPSFNGGGIDNICSCSGQMVEMSGHLPKLNHDPGLSLEWSADELIILEEGLSKYASDSTIVRFAKIAMTLPDKTVRDVALKCRRMKDDSETFACIHFITQKREGGKRRKDEHVRKIKDKREKMPDLSSRQLSHMLRSNGMPNSSSLSLDYDEEIPYSDINGPIKQLFDQNMQAFNKIATNLGNLQLQENITLFCQARDNILSVFNNLNDMTGAMKQMPPLPVKINDVMADSILFTPSMAKR